jgi:hypothetical protein
LVAEPIPDSIFMIPHLSYSPKISGGIKSLGKVGPWTLR